MHKLKLGITTAAFALVTPLTTAVLAEAPPASASPARVAAADPAPEVYGRAVYLLDASSEKARLDKNGGKRMPIASLTKMMTAYLVLRQAKPTDEVKVTSADVDYANDGGGTTADLSPGDRVPVKDLLYGLLLPSGADAAHALARTYGPGVDGFVAKMNATAKQLGLNDTHYVNPDGLPTSKGDGYSTARDQARLAEIALRDPAFAKVTSTPEYTAPETDGHGEYDWTNTNHLLGEPGVIGVKTGFTDAAGFCLAFAADRHGRRLVGVILGEDVSSRRFDTAESLLDWAGTDPDAAA
ncbi:serine hydrolase [Microbispora corallina]|uniref:D-alanyl-D-alanine carboxypeptidase n=1 Tax=Microbispora corallina TaxID=83302 RepID=A0ABQ4FUX0_9ACTN|nr:D-alanyl-D-alanine carboxypeptidase family protein [Microbispora corallina]GIH38619.1 D-alanyl-D-alanine carboxypeptidase [Microbispora corallina]